MEESSDSQETPKQEEKVEFKKPVLFGRVGKLPKKIKNEIEKVKEQKNDEISPGKDSESPAKKEITPVSHPKSTLPPAVLLKEISTPIPYKEPKWSGLCPEGTDYGLEVLKSGMIVEKLDLTNKSYHVFGRLANSDVVMAHPTISRHHAVLQYKAFAEEGEPASGWYLYDLGSTHGTYLNKDRLKQSHYTRVRVGHQIKFGNSSRTYILLGPDFDCEGESELTVTEIKKKAVDLKINRDRLIKEAIEQRERDKMEEERKREEQGIDWGMGEDAEEEPDLAENPFASTANEELYLQDPKKTLRGFFEREGHELTYDCEERGVGQFICKVELPLDDSRGRPVVAEVLHKGKKKEAVVACALEACRVLDRAGLLRKATHESRRRKQRDYSADDYYSSDEDSYLDRTGDLERKRQRRRANNEKEKALTYDDLIKQSSELEHQLQSLEETLRELRAPTTTASAGDSLDDYMSQLASGHSVARKADISKTKMEIQKLKTELAKTQRLAEIARPAHLPPLVQRQDQKKPAFKMAANSVVYGKRIRLKEDKRETVKKEKKEDSEFKEEMDSDEEDTQTKSKDTSPTVKTEVSEKEDMSNARREERIEASADVIDDKQPDDSKTVNKSEKESVEEKEKRVFGPMRPPENYVIPESYFDQESDRDLPEIMED